MANFFIVWLLFPVLVVIDISINFYGLIVFLSETNLNV